MAWIGQKIKPLAGNSLRGSHLRTNKIFDILQMFCTVSRTDISKCRARLLAVVPPRQASPWCLFRSGDADIMQMCLFPPCICSFKRHQVVSDVALPEPTVAKSTGCLPHLKTEHLFNRTCDEWSGLLHCASKSTSSSMAQASFSQDFCELLVFSLTAGCPHMCCACCVLVSCTLVSCKDLNCCTLKPKQRMICLATNPFVTPWRAVQRRTRFRSLRRPRRSC